MIWIFCETWKVLNFSEARSLKAWQCNGKLEWWPVPLFEAGQFLSWFEKESVKWWSWGIIWWAITVSPANHRKKIGIFLRILLTVNKSCNTYIKHANIVNSLCNRIAKLLFTVWSDSFYSHINALRFKSYSQGIFRNGLSNSCLYA